MSVFGILFQEGASVPVESLNLPTGEEGGSWNMCPTKADMVEAASLCDYRDDRSIFVEVEHVEREPGSPTMEELCSNVSKLCFDHPFLDNMFF